MSIPIGSYYDIPIETGISARVKVVSSASLDLTGNARLSTDSLSWSSEGTKTFTVTTYDYASGMITVESNFNFQINLGLVIGMSLFSIEIADTNMGTFPASPTISESMTIPEGPGGISLDILYVVFYFVLVLLLIIGVAYLAYGEKKKARREMKKEISAPKPPKQFTVLIPQAKKKDEISKPEKTAPKTEGVIYCMYCGEKLPSYAVYCRKCGKKVE